ncbi:aurachin C monooxygenase/isomerase-like [Rhodamnia argentea]|uniref:Aurachin C monooxygenase/isomerase-like n=1 Tax=Rhodamnia argentea TaxID=178133 RepID=A0A8B8Q7N7_9MYRT|nr:aurachin C monooxygenase/isomerase-like [Rhodamnia argentea]
MNHKHDLPHQKKPTSKPKAVIVGGSIAGVSCAHALIRAGWDVVVMEKSRRPPKGSPAGAGLSLDPLSQELIRSWTGRPELLRDITSPVTIDLNQAINDEKTRKVLARDENFNHRAAHWAALHDHLFSALPPQLFLWGHLFLSFSVSSDTRSVKIKAQVLDTGETTEVDGDLLVAADGCLSLIRNHFLPDVKLRYSGYCAWRGVFDFSEIEDSETVKKVREAYPELGNCLYVDLAPGNHTGLFEIPNKRLNWIWYLNQPEPDLQGNSVTTKVSDDMIQKMYQDAEKIWHPALVQLMRETKEPFINAIYDCDPLERIVWDKVALVGDAAHPTTPHSSRSTNMSILDAAVLARCLEKWGVENLGAALEEYQSIRLPIASKQVLHARRAGRMKQGLMLPDSKPFNPNTATREECKMLPQRSVPFFGHNPLLGSSNLLLAGER